LEASTVAEGIALAKNQAPHLIISDLIMPEESGFEFLKQIRTIPSLKNTPVLVMSSADDQDSIMKAIALGCLFCNAATGFCGRNATQKVAMTTKMAAAR
jgi:CheY-like chemotaxis protein